MHSGGFSDSFVRPAETCPQCGVAARVNGGDCLSCLLRTGLDPESESDDGSFDELLSEIDVRDRDWRFGNYQILEEIGRGGMGVIYRARQRHSRRIVALKRVLSYHGDSRETLERFRREAEAAASLDHSNILPIYDVGESDGLPFFTMKYATGGNLQQAMAGLGADPRECVRLLVKITRAVACAHRAGILHRDLKPGNILLDGHGEPMVSDFGLAKWIDADSHLTRSLAIFGTPGFIAPEQADGPRDAVTAAADIYSLGAILFALLTGRPPFLGEHALAVIRQASEKTAPRLRSLLHNMDRDLETICACCLEREPDARYGSATNLADDLERWLEGRATIARPITVPVRLWRWARREPAAAAILAGILIAVAVVTMREVERGTLENNFREEQIALRSIAVFPFLNLDSLTSDRKFSAQLASALQIKLTNFGPSRVIAPAVSEWGMAGAAAEVNEIGRKQQVRTALAGTVRKEAGHLRVSFRLIDAARGENLLHYAIEVQSSESSVREVARAIAIGIDSILQKEHLTAMPDAAEDPGLQRSAARDFIIAGRELADRRSSVDLDRAIQCFEKAIAAEPSSSVAHAQLALACLGRTSFLFDEKLLARGEAAAREAIRLGPNRSEAHRALAMVLETKGDFPGAQEEIYRAIDLDGLKERLASHLGAIAVMMGRPDRALRWSRIASQWQSRPAAYEHLVGDCLTELELDADAEIAYRHVADLQPEMPEAWMGLCRLRLLQGKGEEARNLWLANRTRYENFEFAQQMGAQVEFFTRHFPEAQKIYARLSQTAPDGGDQFFGALSYKSALGELLLRAGEGEAGRVLLGERLTQLQKIRETATGNSQILYEMAAIEATLQEPDAAIGHLAAASAAGWLDHRSAQIDPRFDGIRATVQFREIIDGMRQRVISLQEGVSEPLTN